MKVRLKNVYAGPKGTFQPKTEIDVDVEEGKALIAGGYAEAVSGQIDHAASRPADKPAARKKDADKPAADAPADEGEKAP